MSIYATKQFQKWSKGSIYRKLVFVLLLVAIIPMNILLATVATGMFQNVAIIIAVIAQVAGLLVGFNFISGIVRQAATINETLAQINNGDFEARAKSVTTDELGKAAVDLNAMCDNTLNLIQSNDERDHIQTSIDNLIAEMNEIAAGNLTITAKVNNDMTGSIAESVNHMTGQLQLIVQQAQSAAKQVTTLAARIRESSTTISQDSDAQARRISQASGELLEMTGSFQNVAELTKESVQVAVEARQTASNGLKAVSDTVDGMQRIRDQVQSTSKRIKKFGESSQEIGEIVQLISDITDRTSILALNASIQAAMAGDAGQGFAVVAEEIEHLADNSKDATKKISKLIRSIQNETSEVISDMEESTREVVAGSELATQAGATLFEIDSVSNQLVELIQNSSTSALQQADRATEIASSMSEISLSTKESAEQSREATRSVGRLADRVDQLRDSVSQFNVAAVVEQVEMETKPANVNEWAASYTSAAEPAGAGRQDNRSRRLRENTDLNDMPGSGRDDQRSDNQKNRPSSGQTNASEPVKKKTVMFDSDDAATATDLNEAIDDGLLAELREATDLINKAKQSINDNVDSDSQKNQTSQDQTTSRAPVNRTIILDQ